MRNDKQYRKYNNIDENIIDFYKNQGYTFTNDNDNYDDLDYNDLDYLDHEYIDIEDVALDINRRICVHNSKQYLRNKNIDYILGIEIDNSNYIIHHTSIK